MASFEPGTIIFTSTAGSTQATGSWYSVHPKYGDITFQIVLAASSVGATASTTCYVQVANSTAAPCAAYGASMALTCTTDTVSDGTALSASMRGTWKFMRVFMNSLSTSTAGSAGKPSVNVYAFASKKS